MPTYPTPQTGASLLLSFNSPLPSSSKHHTLLVLAPTRISSLRTFAALEAGYKVLVGASPIDSWDPELALRRERGEVSTIDWNLAAEAGEDEWAAWFDNLSAEVKRTCMMVVLGDTMPRAGSAGSGAERRTFASAQAFAKVANERRYLVNVADAPTLSDFSFPVTHRFDLGNETSPAIPTKSPLQLALTTNSSACRLATRLRREIVASLPSNVGAAVLAVSQLRAELAAEAAGDSWSKGAGDSEEVELSGVGFNRPVEQLTREKSERLERGLVEEEREASPCRARALGRRSESRGHDSVSSVR